MLPRAPQVLDMSPIPPRFPITSLFIVRRGPLADEILDRAWTPKDSTDQTSIQDAILSLMHERDAADGKGRDRGPKGFVYGAQCGDSKSVQDQCWVDAVRGHFVATKPLPGLYMTGSWCAPDEMSNLTLTCPCIPDGAGDWCLPADAPSSATQMPCGVGHCHASETIFVHFGTWQMEHRAHEIDAANAWSCPNLHPGTSASASGA